MMLRDWLRKQDEFTQGGRTPQQRANTAHWKYHSPMGFVAAEGCSFESAPLTGAELKVLKEPLKIFRIVREKFEFQQCYANSQTLVQFDLTKTLRYAEGYAVDPGGLPFLHGWVVLNDKVVDFTGPPTQPLPDEPPQLLGVFAPREYIGAVFPRSQVVRTSRLTKEWGSLIDDWERGFPLLEHGRTGRPRRQPKGSALASGRESA